MPSSNKVDNINILKATGFEFGIQRAPNLVWFTQEVNIPGIALGDASKQYATGKVAIPGDTLEYNELTLTFTVDESLNNWREIYNWMRGLAPTRLGKEGNQYDALKKSNNKTVSDGMLIILTNASNPNITLYFRDLFPISLSDINLTTTVSSIDVITATVSFRYTNYDFETNLIHNTVKDVWETPPSVAGNKL